LLDKLAALRKQVSDMEVEALLASRNGHHAEIIGQLKAKFATLDRQNRRLADGQQRARRLYGFFKDITEHLPLAVQVIELASQNVIYTNPCAYRLLGYSPQQIKQMGPWFMETVTHPEDYEDLGRHFQALAQAPDHQALDHRRRVKQADGRWLELTTHDTVFRRDAQGKPTQILSLLSKATEEPESAQEPMPETAGFREAFDHLPWGAVLCRPDQGVVAANQAFLQLTGYRAEDLVGLSLDDLTPLHLVPGGAEVPEPVAPASHSLKAGLRPRQGGAIPARLEVIPLPGPDTEPPWWLVVVHSLDQPGQPLPSAPETAPPPAEPDDAALELERAVVAVQREMIDSGDINAVAAVVMERAKQLTRSRYGFVGVADTAEDRLTCPVIDRQVWDVCQIEDKEMASHKFGGLLGQARITHEPLICQDLAGDPRAAGTPPGHIPLGNLLSVPVMHGGEFLGQIALSGRNGDYSQDHLAAVQRLAGIFAAALMNHRRRQQAGRLEFQIQQAQKMEAIGHMAEGISNDFNNLLQTINGYSEILLLDKNPDDEQYHYLKEITAAANQATNLISQLLAFSRKFASHRRPEDLNHRVRRFKEALEKKVSSSAGPQPRLHIKMNLADDLAKVNADPVQLEQMLCNLADNAIDASGREVTIQVRTRNTTLDEQFCDAHQGAKPGDYVQLTFRDQGRGMDRGTLRRIFEPFFTTKQSGRGSGMGLAMVYGIVKNHDGYINCQSQLGLGTTFDIYLPALGPAAGNLWREDPADIPGGSETILLVDDEEAIRELSSRMLRSHGYQVVSADSGESALDLFRQDPAKIDLVLLDLAMPGMGGIRCLKEMRTIAPQAKIIIVTGYLADSQLEESLSLGAKGLISKPFHMSTLLRKVRAVLDA